MNRLSFDDGPTDIWTPAILDILLDHDEQATFYVLGSAIFGRAELLRRMSDEGHQIGVHGFSHTRLTTLDPDEVRQELSATAEMIEWVVGVRPAVWRAPYFDAAEREQVIGRELGLTHHGANVVPDDWAKDDPEEIARIVLAEWSPGRVVCLHDGIPPDGGNGTGSRAPTVEAVRLILEGWS